jgi:hypothetical protein
MRDMQEVVPGIGDFPMHLKTAYSIQLNAALEIKEWENSYW